MSYILEALKKIEAKQQREGGPRLLTLPPDIPEERKKRSVLPFVIAGALLLNAAVMTAWWMSPRTAHKQPGDVQSIAPPETVPPATSESLPALPAPFREKDSLSEQRSKAVEKPVPSTHRGREKKAFEGASLQAKKTEQPAGGLAEALPQKEKKGNPGAPRAKLDNLEDLPAAVRSSLPEFKISGHAYSPEPRFRVARVNNKIVQEGEALNQGLKVDEIVPGGVIFTFQGYRFRVGINDDK